MNRHHPLLILAAVALTGAGGCEAEQECWDERIEAHLSGTVTVHGPDPPLVFELGECEQDPRIVECEAQSPELVGERYRDVLTTLSCQFKNNDREAVAGAGLRLRLPQTQADDNDPHLHDLSLWGRMIPSPDPPSEADFDADGCNRVRFQCFALQPTIQLQESDGSTAPLNGTPAPPYSLTFQSGRDYRDYNSCCSFDVVFEVVRY